MLGGLLAADSHPGFRESDKAFYLSEKDAELIRPGLVMRITAAEIAADGTIRCRFKLTDRAGVPLDIDGIQTPGPIRTSFIAAYIPKGQTQYVAYTIRRQTSPITGASAVQASSDTGGRTDKVAVGEYIYTFGANATTGFDKTVTHTIGIYGSRNLTEFDLGTQYADHTLNFVPDGTQVKVVRDVIRTEGCNRCHQDLGLHGGSRKTMEICVLCHTPQTVDPDTGNSVDMPVMTHKIHMGSSLPSVQAGKRYIIIGNNQSVHDYSGIAFPPDARDCAACHQTPASQASNVFKANRAACGACHDDVDFSAGKNHADLPQISDNQCTNCHVKEGELAFDVSVIGAHIIPNRYVHLPGVDLKLLQIFDGAPGKKATIQFSLKDGQGAPLPASQMTRLDLRLSGSNSDYYTTASESAIRAEGANGIYYWTFQNVIPANAKGSWVMAARARRDIKINEGTLKAVTARDNARNQVVSFSVDGSSMQNRRKVVDLAKCNACHSKLGFHGDGYNQVEMCVQCHNPTAVAGTGAAAQSIDFRIMIHKIHAGHELTRGYKIGNSDFSHIGYPGILSNCSGCHLNGSENVPLKADLLNVADPQGFVNPAPPATAACLSCHDTKEAASHAMANITSLGESCGACHGQGKELSVSKAHAR
jgi:OmcA/MtrC family decaheme c-type cytochrome